MVVFYIVVIVLSVWLLIKMWTPRSNSGTSKSSFYTQTDTHDDDTGDGYPYRPDVEFRLPDGRITTNGYAARNPNQFRHWMHGPNNVYGENIDLADWEDWRINYYGE